MDLSAASIRRALVPRRLAARLRVRGSLEDWLRDADLRRHGLPADAIAIVRQLRVPWAQVAGPPGAVRHETLEAVLRGARRPALEPGGAGGAPAVWFVDQSELLACLARDAIEGSLSARWWWPTLLRGEVDRAAAMRYWIASARAVPRAVQRLQSIGVDAAWFKSWSTPERRGLLTTLADHYPMSAAVRRFVDAGSSTMAAKADHVPADSGWRGAVVERHSEDGVAAWYRSAVPSAPIRLHQLCLALVRDPACAFDARYVERALLRESPPAGEKRAPFGAVASPPNLHSPATTPVALAGQASNATGSDSNRTAAPIARDAQPARPTTSLQGFEAATRRVPDDPVLDALTLENGATAEDARRPIDDSGATVSSAAIDDDTVFETGHGGLFFVLTAALQLGLYGDFSQPLHRGLEISPWRFLYETGAALGGRRFVRDPLAEWLERFPSADTGSGSPDSVQQLEARSIVLARVLPPLRARLVLALGLRDPRRLAGTLLRLPAQVRAGGERIDVCFALQQLPIAVRLAGLDRDPGWVPAAGRDLRFHFE